MFKRILVPVDGSSFSEAVLPRVREMAAHDHSDVVFVRVNDDYEPPLGTVLYANSFPESLLLTPVEYIDQLVAQFRSAGIKAEGVVTDGPVAHAVLDATREMQADVIVMSTHGRSGLNRLLMGSVAEKVVHGTHVPVLLVKPELVPA